MVVIDVVNRKDAGMTPDAILGDHPRLTLDDIRAAHAFALGEVPPRGDIVSP